MSFCGCSEVEDLPVSEVCNDNAVINIGGLSMDELSVKQTTRAADPREVDAETIDWLVDPLKSGLDITYGKWASDGTEHNKHVAILKLLTNDDGTIKYSTYTDEDGVTQRVAEYSFLYKTNEGTGTDAVTQDDPAKWYDNGFHFFEGVYVPEQLRNSGTSKPADLTTDQSGNNYTYLERYLAMPANHHIAATISRIRLPFKHRLSRVIAYVLIDPAMGAGVTIRGYKKTQTEQENNIDDPKTTEISFGKVKVLSGVDEKTNGELTPRWTTEGVRKVIPHYVGENAGIDKDGNFIEGNEFIIYHHKKHDEYYAPSSNNYAAARTDFESKGASSAYEKITYTNVPCYDLIVEPSYSDKEHVMYDEDGYYNNDGTINDTKVGQLAAIQNQIEFEITLSNGLQYTKTFHFNDLDANWQTAVYLRISKESIDYDNSGAVIWNNTSHNDGYYGVNNQNGNVLSDAGSSWQRAFRIKTVNYSITDGSNYHEDNEDDHDANKDGQYVSHDNWVKAFAQAVAGGIHHGDYFVLDDDIEIDATMLPDNFVFTGHLDGRGNKITLTNTGTPWTEYVMTTDYSVTPLYSDQNGTVFSLPTLYRKTNDEIPATYYTAEDQEVIDGTKQVGDIKTNAVPAQYELVNPTVTEVAQGIYFTKSGDEYPPYSLPTLYKAVAHTSGTALFAGLNGDYDAAVGEANVHKEGNYLVPVKGYRAELLNIIFNCTPFADGASITGYINNCQLMDGTSVDHNPGIPEY